MRSCAAPGPAECWVRFLSRTARPAARALPATRGRGAIYLRSLSPRVAGGPGCCGSDFEPVARSVLGVSRLPASRPHRQDAPRGSSQAPGATEPHQALEPETRVGLDGTPQVLHPIPVCLTLVRKKKHPNTALTCSDKKHPRSGPPQGVRGQLGARRVSGLIAKSTCRKRALKCVTDPCLESQQPQHFNLA